MAHKRLQKNKYQEYIKSLPSLILDLGKDLVRIIRKSKAEN